MQPSTDDTVTLLLAEAGALRRWAATLAPADRRPALECAERLEAHTRRLQGKPAEPLKRLRPVLPPTVRLGAVRDPRTKP
jgi:hypothetical protein